MDIASFENFFEKVPHVNVYSQKDVRDRVQNIRLAISSTDENWEERNKGLQELRSLLLQGHLQALDDLPQILRSLEQGLQTTLKDLRSQVCREACITVAYMALRLGYRFETLSELLLPTLIQLIQNTFRIIILSSATCAKYLIKNVQSSRLVTIIASNTSNKSSVIRKHCCEFMLEVLVTWEQGPLERVVAVVAEFIRRSVSDADAEARMFSRKSFAIFSERFPEQGYTLLCSLEPSKQKQLLAEMDHSNPLKTSVLPPSTPTSTSARKPVSRKQSQPDVVPRVPKTLPRRPPPSHTPTSSISRSRQDIDKIRTLQTPKYKAVQSQPSSRAASPGMAMLATPDVTAAVRSGQRSIKRPPKRPGVSQSQCNSREASPSRRRMFESSGVTSRRRNTPRRGAGMDGDVADGRMPWRGRSEDFDGMSETSSICSDNSYKSSCVPVNESLREVLSSLSSGVWGERLEGVAALQEVVAVEGSLSAHELKSVLRSMTKLLHDPHPKVFNSSLDCLRELCLSHHDHIAEWLPSIFKRLLSKAGSEVLSYQQDKISAALNAIRTSFPEEVQFATLCKFIVDQPQNINPKLKSTVLGYLRSVCEGLGSLNNNSDTRLALSKVVCWSNEPKNAQVRKLAQEVICTLNNHATFQRLLSTLPRTLQDTATRLIAASSATDGGATLSRRRSLSRTSNSSNYSNNNYNNNNNNYNNNNNNYNNNNHKNFFNNNCVNKVRRPMKEGRADDDGISDVILKAAEELQSLSVADDDGNNYLDKTMSEWDSDDLGMLLEEIRSADDVESWSGLMGQLSEVARLCVASETWEGHFKMVLLLLLEGMQADDINKRICSLKVLKSLLHSHSHQFVSYVELTVMNLLEFEKETDREVLKQYEDCTGEVSRVFPHHHLVPMLPPVALTASHPLNMAAIKLLTKVISQSDGDDVREFVTEVVPALVKGFENGETSMRKSSMVCLLALHQHLGEHLMPLLSQLNSSKLKLLTLYVKRSATTAPEDSPVTS